MAMKSITKGRWLFAGLLFSFASLLGLSACSDGKPVVIQPGLFSEDWPTAIRGKLIKNNKCAIDSVNGKSTEQQHFSLKNGDALVLAGWVFSEKSGTPPEIYVQLVGPALTYTAVTQTRLARPDVNQTFKLNPDWTPGFELKAVQNAEPNEYQLQVLQQDERQVARCETGIYIKIDPTIK